MRNLLLGIVLGVLALIAAMICLIPPLTYDALPFLWKSHHQKVIHGRAQELIDSLAKDDTDAAIKLTDPQVVAHSGSGIVGVQLKVLSGFVRLAGKDNLRIDEVVLGADAKTAEVKLSHRSGNTWNPTKPSKWVRFHNQWYVTF